MLDRRIYKYSLGIPETRAIVILPTGSKILSVGNQNGDAVLWAVVDAFSASAFRKEIIMVMTGQSIPEYAGKFLGTVQFANGNFIAHYFEGREENRT